MAKGFAAEVEDFTLRFVNGAEDTVRATAIELWSSIIKATPVDEGRARSNWFATGKEPSTRVTDKEDKNGNDTVTRVTRTVVGLKDFSIMTLTNNLPYAQVLEFGGYNDGPKTVGGFSKQAPMGMVRINIKRFNSILEEQARKNLPK